MKESKPDRIGGGKADATELEKQVYDLSSQIDGLRREVEAAKRTTPAGTATPTAASITMRFREAVQVGVGTTAGSSWAKFACAPYVPDGAVAAILTAKLDTGQDNMQFEVRESASLTANIMAEAAATAGDDTVIHRSTCFAPLAQDLTFDWRLTGPGTANYYNWEILLIGWIGPDDGAIGR